LCRCYGDAIGAVAQLHFHGDGAVVLRDSWDGRYYGYGVGLYKRDFE
jgi:hypothetical protein